MALMKCMPCSTVSSSRKISSRAIRKSAISCGESRVANFATCVAPLFTTAMYVLPSSSNFVARISRSKNFNAIAISPQNPMKSSALSSSTISLFQPKTTVSPLFSRRRRARGASPRADPFARGHDAPVQTFRISRVHDAAREQRLKETLLLHAEPRAVVRLRRSRLGRRGRRRTRRIDRSSRGGGLF